MDSRKLLELASGTADYSQHLAVERNLEQPSGIRGFTDKQNLIGSRRDAHRIGRTDHRRKSFARWRLAVDRRDPWRRRHVDGEHTQKFTIVIEDLDAPVRAVANIDIVVTVDNDGMRKVELAGGRATCSP